VKSPREIARKKVVDSSYVIRMVNLSLLAPEHCRAAWGLHLQNIIYFVFKMDNICVKCANPLVSPLQERPILVYNPTPKHHAFRFLLFKLANFAF